MWPFARLVNLPTQILLIIVTVLLLPTSFVEATDPIPESWKVYEERYPVISLEKLESVMETNEVTLIDANKSETYRNGHIPGALLLNRLIEVEKKNGLPKNKKSLIVVYCGGPQCTSWHKAADFAKRKGFKNIRHFKGGLKEWKEKGRVLEMTM